MNKPVKWFLLLLSIAVILGIAWAALNVALQDRVRTSIVFGVGLTLKTYCYEMGRLPRSWEEYNAWSKNQGDRDASGPFERSFRLEWGVEVESIKPSTRLVFARNRSEEKYAVLLNKILHEPIDPLSKDELLRIEEARKHGSTAGDNP